MKIRMNRESVLCVSLMVLIAGGSLAQEAQTTPTVPPNEVETQAATPEAIPEAAPEATPAAAPEEAAPAATPEATPEEEAPAATPEATPEEVAPAATPEATPEEVAPAATPEAAPTTTPEAAPPAIPKAEGPKQTFEEWNKKTKQPFSWWKWGADLRLRDENMNNTMTLDSKVDRHDQNYLRFRARFWNTLTPVKDLSLNVRMTIESRYWTKESFSKPLHEGWDWYEIVFDQLNVRWQNVAHRPLTLSIGRQDLSFGDRWLIFEGTPLDGSRTIYFDAARATAEIKKWKSTVDAVYIDQAARNNAWLPPLRIADDRVKGVQTPVKKPQIEHNEKGIVLYVTNKYLAKKQIDGYYIYKKNSKEDILKTDSEDMQSKLKSGEDAQIHTLGARFVAGPLSIYGPVKDITVSAEAAYQTGERNKVDVSAIGFNSSVMYTPPFRWNQQFRLAYEYLQGDNPATKNQDGQFDILWGRWPRWSELYIYTYAPETRIAQLANLHRVGPGWTVKPCSRAEFHADYYWLIADRNTKTSALFSKEDNVRGRLLTTKLLLKYNAHIAGHLWGEFFSPGNFYSPIKQDAAKFLRAELYLTW